MPQEFNTIQQIKRRFFAMRNGVIADTLRRAGSPYRIIFGLNLPQLIEIAQSQPKDAALARQLWANATTRESMLLAPMLFPVEELTLHEAQLWIDTAPCTEAIDLLCHRLLRHFPEAYRIIEHNSDSESAIARYAALHLAWQFINTHADDIRLMAEKELQRDCAITTVQARRLIDEIDFLTQED